MRTSVPFAGAWAAALGATPASGAAADGETSVAEGSVTEGSVTEDWGADEGAADWPSCSWKASADVLTNANTSPRPKYLFKRIFLTSPHPANR